MNQIEERESDAPELEKEELEESDTGGTDPLMSDPFDPTKIQIISKQDTLLNLINRLRHDEIDMNTDFQRHADLWSPQKMSRLIESILIRFPLPAFYFDASNDNKWLIVDGLQRLSAIRKFVVEEGSGRLSLHNLEYLKEFEGKPYNKLPRQYLRRIDECPVTLFLIQPGTPNEVKYSVFRRINTGGLVLTNQEIRNAMAKPRERRFLESLAKDANMVLTLGDQSKRMQDQELVLRFIAFFRSDFQKSRKNIAEFLDEANEGLRTASDNELKTLESTFRRVMHHCAQLFGDTAFEKRAAGSPGGRRRKNSSLFEAWTVNLAKLEDDQIVTLVNNKRLLVDKLSELLSDENSDFFRAISMATQKRENVSKRHGEISRIIQEVIHA